MTALRLRHVAQCVLPVRPPFNFRYTFWKPSHFATGLEQHDITRTWRTFRFGEVVCGVIAQEARAGVAFDIYSSTGWRKDIRDRLVSRLRIAYGFDESIDGFLRRARRQRYMRAALGRLAGMRMSCPESIFEIAIISLLLQNATIARSTQMMANLLRQYGRRVRFGGTELWSFFSPADVVDAPEEELRQVCRLGYRAKYIHGFANFFVDRDDDELRYADATELMAELRTVRGVGPYTAGIVASHALRDPGAIALDVWNRRILARHVLGIEEAPPAEITAALEADFGEQRGLAAVYLIENEYVDKPLVPLSSSASRPPTNARS